MHDEDRAVGRGRTQLDRQRLELCLVELAVTGIRHARVQSDEPKTADLHHRVKRAALRLAR
jgi:hypothetical protein